MAEICCESDASPPCESNSSRAARKRRMEIRRVKFVNGVTPVTETTEQNGLLVKRPKLDSISRPFDNAVDNCYTDADIVNDQDLPIQNGRSEIEELAPPTLVLTPILNPLAATGFLIQSVASPKFGATSVCGRRRDMEDAVAIHPSFSQIVDQVNSQFKLHYFAVYDGHGCSHVAAKCKERLHELVKEEVEKKLKQDVNIAGWEPVMERSFSRMEKEVIVSNKSVIRATCRCELQSPECDAVGSTAIVAVVTPHKIIVANCGDSRAVLCCNGKAVPLSNDHKPDRPDELNRIEKAGGRVIYWDGPRVLGVLAMSRAIGDNYLKPYVICEPEVTIIDRTVEDECLILASDGLWDVVSNDTACGVARMCLKGKGPLSGPPYPPEVETGGENSDKACSDASMLLTKLALARRSSDNVSVVVVDLRKDT